LNETEAVGTVRNKEQQTGLERLIKLTAKRYEPWRQLKNVADDLEIKAPALSKYLAGERAPQGEHLDKLAGIVSRTLLAAWERDRVGLAAELETFGFAGELTEAAVIEIAKEQFVKAEDEEPDEDFLVRFRRNRSALKVSKINYGVFSTPDHAGFFDKILIRYLTTPVQIRL